MPWIVSFAFIAFIAVVAALSFRNLRNLWGRIRSGEKKMDDDWDPFS